jgi:hypothetical protein
LWEARMPKPKLSRQDQAVVDEVLARLRQGDARKRAERERFGAAWVEWVKNPVGPRPEPPPRPVGDPSLAVWEPVRFPGDRRLPGEVLPRLRSSRETRLLDLAIEGRRTRHTNKKKAEGGRAAFARNTTVKSTAAKNRRIVERAARDGFNIKQIAREFGLDPKTVRKYYPSDR